jgi:hypothetical protein
MIGNKRTLKSWGKEATNRRRDIARADHDIRRRNAKSCGKGKHVIVVTREATKTLLERGYCNYCRATYAMGKWSYPRSKLQDLNGRVQYAIHFLLHEFNYNKLGTLDTSLDTEYNINMYNIAVRKLKASIKADYDRTREALRESKKQFDHKPD